MNNTANLDNSEEILLYSAQPGDKLDKPDAKANVSFKFGQHVSETLQGKKLIIYDNQYLSVTNYVYKKKQQYWLNLCYLSPNPQKQWIVNWKWLGAALCFGLLAAISGLTPIIQLISGASLYRESVVVIFTTVAVLCVVALIRQSKNVVHFNTCNGAVPVLELFNNKPDRTSFNAFLAKFQEKIHQAQENNQYMNPDEQLAAELSEHRQLMQNKVITAEAYERAKLQLFNLHNTRT